MADAGNIRLSVIVPSLAGDVPQSLRSQVEGRADVELVVVKGVRPVGRARNEGLRRATGDYITWVDADDEVEEGWLGEILTAVESKPDVVVFGYKWMVSADFWFERIWRGGDLLGDLFSQNGILSAVWIFAVHRSLWRDVRFDETARTMEDWEALPNVLAGAQKVIRVERPLYRYYVRGGSLTHQRDEKMQREFFQRAVGRVEEVKRLGLWRRYRRVVLAGVGAAAYDCAENLVFGGHVNCQTRREAERWLRWHLPALLLTPARLTFKAKWVLAALGGWCVIRWYYVRIQGRRIEGLRA